MYLRVPLLLSLFLLLTACVTTQTVKGPSLKERMEVAGNDLNFVSSNDPAWCDSLSQCELLGQLTCTVMEETEERGERACKKKLKREVLQLGGDTFVLQDKGWPPRQELLYSRELFQYRAYGQAFKCSDKNVALGNEANQEFRSPVVSPLNIYSKNYFDQCKPKEGCRKIEENSCSSMRSKGFILCVQKHEKERISKGFDTLVINDEAYHRMGSYRMFRSTYACE